MKEYIVDLEEFPKSEQREELDSVLIKSGRRPTGDVSFYDNVLETYQKYMMKYGSTNIKIRTNRCKPHTYKVTIHEIDIVN